MSTNPAPRAATLSTWDTVSVIVGIVIGAGIYETPPDVFANAGGPTMALATWLIGGVLCLVGALTYAELASAFPRSGGDYVYLTKAYGSWLGFLFGWAQISVILTGSIGMMAYVFANYASRLWSFGESTALVYAAGAVIVLTLLNLRGVSLGKYVQNVLSSAKLLGLGLVVIAGLVFAAPPAVEAARALEPEDVATGSLGFAFVAVFLTYGGWNDAAFFVAEMSEPRRIIRALTLGILIIIATYLFVNLAYLRVLGFEGARASRAIAADTMRAALGDNAAAAIATLVAISALGAVNGLIFAGSRVYAAVGEDHRAFALLARKDARFRAPVWALTVQAVITLAMLALVGTKSGQAALDSLFTALHLEGVDWKGQSGFITLLRCTAPVFWLFFLLTSISLFVLRYRQPDVPRPFRVPLYPLLPLLFAATCAYMLRSGMQYAGSLGLVGGTLLLAGLPVYWLSRGVGGRHRTPGGTGE
jgi:basic amino acid/polyamine antiporter, APA family